jgi:hypothetical protein
MMGGSMIKAKKPVAPKKLTAMEKMIEDCVKKAKARKKSGQTDQEWRKSYADSLKVGGETVKFSETPFAGDTIKKKI